MRRRAQYLGRRLAGRDEIPLVWHALQQLLDFAADIPARRHSAHTPVCPGLAARLAATLSQFGEDEAAQNLCDYCLSFQHPTGAFSDSLGLAASPANTAELVRTALLLSQIDRANSAPLQSPASSVQPVRAANWLAERVDSHGAFRWPAPAGPAREYWTGHSGHLLAVAPLLQAGVRWNQPELSAAAERAAHWARRLGEIDLVGCGTGQVAMAGALWELGEIPLATRALEMLRAWQTREGGIRLADGLAGAAAVAQAARLWLRLGWIEPAARAIAWVERRLHKGSLRRTNKSRLDARDVDTVCQYALAVQQQVQTTFAGDVGQELPSLIDAQDGRVRAVCQWLRGCKPTGRLLDAGCGSGRFLAHIQGWLPEVGLIGVDPSPALLAGLPPGVERQVGTLLRLPRQTASVDAVLAIESLEHALSPRKAIEELCRIVRPGGRILIIDKNRSFWALSLHAPWEHWFEPAEVTNWLAPFCQDITCQSIAHGQQRQPTGLFLCWQATRGEGASAQGQRRAA